MSGHDIGGRLRHAREQRGLTLHDAATSTKLSLNVLRAIERNDFDHLPAGMYRKAYVRTLAAAVGLDPREIAADYDASHEPAGVPRGTAAAVTPRDTLIDQLAPSRRRMILPAVALLTVMAAWFRLQPEPGATRARDGARVDEAAVAAASLTAGKDVTATEERSARAGVATSSTPVGAPLTIVLAAIDRCWVTAERDGERVLYRLVEPGERITLEGQRKISLRLGDAGAVSLSINGSPPRTAGRSGQVIRFAVTPDDVERLRGVAPGAARSISDRNDVPIGVQR